MNTITRKIKLNIVSDVKESYKKLYDWNEMCFRAANTAATHMYFQSNMKEFFYLTDSAKILFSDINKTDKEKDKGAERVLTTSKANTTYQVLSSIYKGKMPAAMFSGLNTQLAKTFSKESKEYFSGKRSLRTYRRDMPMPAPSQAIRNIVKEEKGYSFDLYGIRFITFFGKDLSGNRIIFERAMQGEYKLCDSSIQLDGKDIFLLAVFQFESTKFELDGEKTMYAELSSAFPIVLTLPNGKKINVGDRAEYLHRRIAIQAALRRQQVSARYNINGKGREKKMKNIERFHKAESDYITTRQHQYTRKMIDLCLQNKCANLELKLTPEPPEPKELTGKDLKQWRIDNELLLRNWGYHGLKEKIMYKAKIVGIEIILNTSSNHSGTLKLF